MNFQVKNMRRVRPSDVYGSAHLLRLMLKVGGLLNLSTIKERDDIETIEEVMHDFLSWLDENR